MIRHRRPLAAAGSILALVGLLFAGVPASAAAPSRCHPTTLAQNIGSADVVFRGQVRKVSAVRGHGKHRTRTYGVVSDRVYRSSLVQPSVVVTARVGTACALPTLAKDRRYIFFVKERGARLLATSGTARATSQLTRQVVKRLGSGAQPEPTAPPVAELTQVAGANPPALSRLLAPGAALLIISLLGLLVVGRLGRRSAE